MSVNIDIKAQTESYNEIHKRLQHIFNKRLLGEVLQHIYQYLDSSSLTLEEFKENSKNLSEETFNRIVFLSDKLLPDKNMGEVRVYPGGRKILVKNFQFLTFEFYGYSNLYTHEDFFESNPIFNVNYYNDGRSLLLEDILLANGVLYPIGNPLTAHLYIRPSSTVIQIDDLVANHNPYVFLSEYEFMKRYVLYIRRVLNSYYSSIGTLPITYGSIINELQEELTLLEQRPLELSEFVNPYTW